MSISVEIKMTGDITTPEHQAAIKSIMDAVEKAANDLEGIPFPIKGSRSEYRSFASSRSLMADGTINPEQFPEPWGYMKEARMQFGFHLNPVKPSEPQE
jgi:hypothetical protein